MKYIFFIEKSNNNYYYSPIYKTIHIDNSQYHCVIHNYNELIDILDHNLFHMQKFIFVDNQYKTQKVLYSIYFLLFPVPRSSSAIAMYIQNNKFIYKYITEKNLCIDDTFYIFPQNDLFGFIKNINLDILSYFPDYINNMIINMNINYINCYWVNKNFDNKIYLSYIYKSSIYLSQYDYNVNNISNDNLQNIKNFLSAQEFLQSIN